MAAWDTRDQELYLRTKMAKVIAARHSGIDPEMVVPNKDDYDLADEFARAIDRYYRID